MQVTSSFTQVYTCRAKNLRLSICSGSVQTCTMELFFNDHWDLQPPAINEKYVSGPKG